VRWRLRIRQLENLSQEKGEEGGGKKIDFFEERSSRGIILDIRRGYRPPIFLEKKVLEGNPLFFVSF